MGPDKFLVDQKYRSVKILFIRVQIQPQGLMLSTYTEMIIW